jgi:hypothetical protein
LDGTNEHASIVGSQNCDASLFAWSCQPKHTAQFPHWYATSDVCQILLSRRASHGASHNVNSIVAGDGVEYRLRSVIDAAEHDALFGGGGVLLQLIFKFLSETLHGSSSFFTAAEPKEWMQDKVLCSSQLLNKHRFAVLQAQKFHFYPQTLA